ncbi:MAG: YajQ family cyclic di-GMP-binding protein [Phycisphaeraceae bacterium]|nr:YajQ family cyclic di-GMP-binding protein [Phycisphaeraceae bacterium]
MPSLDIVSRINFAELDNAINNTLKAVATRFDFRNSPVEITVDRKEKKLKMVAADDGKMKGLHEMFTSAVIKRGLHLKSFEFGEMEQGAAGHTKREVKLKEGLTPELAKQIAKMVKETKIKVQASIQGDEVRLTGKNIDDLRTIMAMLDKAGLEQPLQYINMKS